MKKEQLTFEEKLNAEMERERRARVLEQHEKSGHGVPRTRREFLSSGLTSAVCMAMAPSFLQMILASRAEAALSPECQSLLAPTPGWTPYVHVHLAGGGALGASVLILDQNRQLLPHYGRLGLGKTSNFSVTKRFGNVPLATSGGTLIGKIMEGVLEQAGTAEAKTSLIPYCVRSQDDDGGNPFSLMGLVNALGARGTELPNLATSTRGNISNVSAYFRTPSMQTVRSMDGLKEFLAPAGALASVLQQPSQKSGLLKLVRDLTASQRAKLGTSSSARTLGQLAECSSSKNMEISSTVTPESLDPRSNGAIAAAWGLSADMSPRDNELVKAALVYNCLIGRSGSVRMDLGAFDYHGSPRSESDGKDKNGGIFLGRILKTAEILQRRLFLHVTSDGAVEARSSDTAGANYAADAGSRGVGYIFAYDPKGRPATVDQQIGQYTVEQAADHSFVGGWNVERSSLAVFANYLKLHGRLGDLEKIAPGVFDATALSKLIKFA